MKLLKKEKDKQIIFDKKFDRYLVDIDDLDNFDCGNDELNKYMTDCIKGNHAVVHGLYDTTNNPKILAGICLLKCSAYIEKIKLNYNDDGEIDEDNPMNCELFPAIEILYFAMDTKYQDVKIVEDDMDGCLASYYLDLIMDDIMNSSEIFSKVDYILLYSVESAINFYEHSGFSKFEDNAVAFKNEKQVTCTPMYWALE